MQETSNRTSYKSFVNKACLNLKETFTPRRFHHLSLHKLVITAPENNTSPLLSASPVTAEVEPMETNQVEEVKNESDKTTTSGKKKKKKRNITWAQDDKLVMYHYYEPDDEERGVKFSLL